MIVLPAAQVLHRSREEWLPELQQRLAFLCCATSGLLFSLLWVQMVFLCCASPLMLFASPQDQCDTGGLSAAHFLFASLVSRSAALLASASLAVVLVDARPAALLAPAPYVVVLADARPPALLAPASLAVVLADARPAALLAPASYAVVLADARPAAWLAPASLVVVLADAYPAAWLALASSAVVLADARPSVVLADAACPATAHFLSMLLLLGLVAFLGRGTLSILHSLLFAFAFKGTLLDLGLFLSLLSSFSPPAPPPSPSFCLFSLRFSPPAPIHTTGGGRPSLASFVLPSQLLVLSLILIKLWARGLSFLASLWLRAVFVGGVGLRSSASQRS